MTSWDDVRRTLQQELGRLAVGEFVVAGEPRPPAGPPRGLLRRRETPPFRFVQSLLIEDSTFYAECVGATLFGGDWEVSPDQHERLRGLGWYCPGDDNPWEAQPSYPAYFCYCPTSDSDELAGRMVSSLEVLGVDPDRLEWTTDR